MILFIVPDSPPLSVARKIAERWKRTPRFRFQAQFVPVRLFIGSKRNYFELIRFATTGKKLHVFSNS
jgi:hypothetical protein